MTVPHFSGGPLVDLRAKHETLSPAGQGMASRLSSFPPILSPPQITASPVPRFQPRAGRAPVHCRRLLVSDLSHRPRNLSVPRSSEPYDPPRRLQGKV